MKGQELIIKFKDDLAFITDEIALDLRQVDISERPLRFQQDAFWTVRVINHIEHENRLFVEVLSYQVGDSKFPNHQVLLADVLMSIEKINFKSIDTTGLLRTLNSRGPVRIPAPKPETVDRSETPKPEPAKRTIPEVFYVPIKNITFLNGGVAFAKKLSAFSKPAEFQIINEDIIEEYDAIKNYFESVLGTKKIEVVATIETVDGAIQKTNATSEEISRINKSLIEEVKLAYLKTIRKKDPRGDKEIFTKEEYIETFKDEGESIPPFFKDENEFFEKLLHVSDSRHYKHLRFLSSRQRHDILKLRFVQKPFSFIFLLSGQSQFYFVWETLDTEEATYIWSFPNDIAQLQFTLLHIDRTIKLIREKGKNDYINLKEENFHRVFHDYGDIEMGFQIWKQEIEFVIK